MEGVSEKTVGKLHDVGLVYTCDLLPVISKGEAESKLGDPLGFRSCDDLERFDDARDRLMLQARVFALGILSNYAHIHIIMSSSVARYVFDEDNRRIYVEFLS